MNRRTDVLLRAAALCALAAVTACGGHGSVLPARGSSALAPYTGPAALADFSWGAQRLAGAAYLGPARFGSMGVNVAMQMRDVYGLEQYAQSVSDPASPLYRHFLTPQQIADRFAASQQSYDAVARYFAARGLHVGGWPQRELLFVSGPQAALESAFGTSFGLYEKDGVQFVAPSSPPHFAEPLAVAAVAGLIQKPNLHTYEIPVQAGKNTFLGYSPQQVQGAFDYAGAYAAGYTGSGVTVGIIGTGPISAADVPAYGKLFKAQVAPVTQVDATDSAEAAGLAQAGIPTPNPNPSSAPQAPYAYGDFGLASPPPVTAPCTPAAASEFPTASCNPEDGEAQLDTEQIASLAPGSSVLFYLAFNPRDCANNACSGIVPNAIGAQGLAIADDEIAQAIADDKADVLSLSYGGGETDNVGYLYGRNGVGYAPMEFATLAAEGIAVFVSSGDSGAEECSQPQPCVSYPSGDVNVTSVGGVTAALNDWGQLTSQLTAWGYQTQAGYSGSGGGVSQIFAAPAWQSRNVAGVTMREQPDVALLADQNTGVAVLSNAFSSSAESLGPTGGTSVAAPQMAAMWALVLQACKSTPSCATASGAAPYRLGNAAPVLYAIYGGTYAKGAGGPSAFSPALPYANVFFDVLYGDTAQVNPAATPAPGSSSPPLIAGCCSAGPGYDEATGLGVPFAGHLIEAITGRKVN